MAQKNTNMRISVDTSQARSQIESLSNSLDAMTEKLKAATEAGDFRGAANIASAINQAQQARNGITRQANSGGGGSGGGSGFVDAVAGAGNYANALSHGNVAGASAGLVNGVGNAAVSAGKAVSKMGAGTLGKVLGVLGIGGLALGAIGSTIGSLSDKYQSYLPGLSAFMRHSGGDEEQWFRGATPYTEGTALSQMDLIELATQQAEFGLYGNDALQRAQMIGRFSYNTGVDAGTISRLQGLSDRFGVNEDAIGNAYGGFLRSGLERGREQEFFDGVLRVMEEGISAGFVRSSEEVAKNLSLLAELSGGNAAWEGQYGAQKLSQINSGFANATNLQSVTDVMLFDAAKKSTDKTYIDTMKTLEQGFTPELADNFYKTLNAMEGDNYAAKIERLRQASGLNYTGAVELYNVMANAGSYKDYEDYQTAIDAVTKDTKYESDQLKLADAINKLANSTFKVEQMSFNAEMKLQDDVADAILSIEKLLEKLFEPSKPTYEKSLDDIAEKMGVVTDKIESWLDASASGYDFQKMAEKSNPELAKAIIEDHAVAGAVLTATGVRSKANALRSMLDTTSVMDQIDYFSPQVGVYNNLLYSDMGADVLDQKMLESMAKYGVDEYGDLVKVIQRFSSNNPKDVDKYGDSPRNLYDDYVSSSTHSATDIPEFVAAFEKMLQNLNFTLVEQ